MVSLINKIIKYIKNFDYEKSSIKSISKLSISFWVILFAVGKLPTLIEGKDPISAFALSLSIMIISLDIVLSQSYKLKTNVRR